MKEFLTSLVILIAPLGAFAATDIYYSVGTNPANLENASTLTITSGIASFGTAQPNNVGVGDEITYNGSSKCYISGRTDSKTYAVITATGGAPNPGAVPLNSIKRAFNSLSSVVAGAADAAHLNTYDLVAGAYTLQIACYGDGEDAFAAFGWNGYTTSATNFIRIFAPSAAVQVGVSQRHNGAWSTSAYRMRDVDGSYGIAIRNNYVYMEGIQYLNSMAAGIANIGLYFEGTTGCKVEQCIVRADTTNAAAGTSSFGINPYNETDFQVYNNIIYDWRGPAGGYGVYGYARSTIYNNTIYGCGVGIGQSGVSGQNCMNNIVQKCGAAFVTTFNVEAYNISDNASGFTGTGSKNSTTVAFVDPAGTPRDLHLNTTDTQAKDAGTSLSSFFVADIDGQTRTGTWDIGADESGGSSSDITDPTVSAVTIPGAPSVPFGSAQRITWGLSDDRGVVRCSLWISFDGGTNYSFVADTSAAQITNGAKTWVVPSTATAAARIRVRAYDAAGRSGEAVSSLFTIADPSAPTTVVLQQPNGSETWPATSTQTISWIVGGSSAITACSLFYSTDGAATWIPIWNAAGNPSSYAWQVPQVSTPVCLVKVVVRNAAGTVVSDVSDSPFGITRTPFVSSPDSVMVDPGGQLSYSFTYDNGGQSGQPGFELLNPTALPFPIRIVGNLVIASFVPAAPVPRVDTIGVRFTLGSYSQNFKLRIMVGTPVGIAPKAAVSSPLSLGIEQRRNAVEFMLAMDQAGPYEIAVFDPSGRRIWSHGAIKAQAGSFSVSWHPADAPNAVYVAQLQSQGRRMCRIFRMVK